MWQQAEREGGREEEREGGREGWREGGREGGREGERESERDKIITTTYLKCCPLSDLPWPPRDGRFTLASLPRGALAAPQQTGIATPHLSHQ